jgi:hypothetical protein
MAMPPYMQSPTWLGRSVVSLLHGYAALYAVSYMARPPCMSSPTQLVRSVGNLLHG